MDILCFVVGILVGLVLGFAALLLLENGGPHIFRPKLYAIISRAVEEGCTTGAMRSFKWVEDGESPTEDRIADCCQEGVMNALVEVFDFSEDE